jgi:hypothetical protein
VTIFPAVIVPSALILLFETICAGFDTRTPGGGLTAGGTDFLAPCCIAALTRVKMPDGSATPIAQIATTMQMIRIRPALTLLCSGSIDELLDPKFCLLFIVDASQFHYLAD